MADEGTRGQHRDVAPPPGFVRPEGAAPLDTEAALAATPADATVKGLFFQTALEALASRGLSLAGARRYAPFRDYPMREFNEVLFACARELAGGGPLRAAVTEIGALAFPAFSTTLLGRMLYGVYRERIGAILSLAPRGFELSQHPGQVRAEQVGPSAMTLHFSKTYTQIDSYHVGILRGALTACGVDGEVFVRMNGPGTGDLFVTWTEAAS